MRNLMVKAVAWKQAHQAREEGQTVVEYALVIGLVSLVIIGALATAGTGWITSISNEITTKIGTIV